jgi:peptidoglycan/LPS O-acetylase OafA/YrhL
MYLPGRRALMERMEGSREPWRLGHRPALDGVRGVAIALVLFGHAFAWSRTPAAGSAGVTVFFTLSGFLITSLLLEERLKSGRVSMRSFYERRARRLLPALGLTVLTLLALTPLIGEGLPVRSLIGALTYSTNWLMIGHQDDGLGHLWSLAIEEQFYLVWPLLLVVLARLPRRWLVLLLAATAVGVSLWRQHLWAASANPNDRLYFSTDARSDALLLGCALAVLLNGQVARRASGWWAAVGLAVIAASTTLAGYGFFVVMPTFVALATAAILWSAAQGGAGWLEWRPLVVLGQRSYGLYLLQPVVGWLPVHYLGDSLGVRVLVMLPLAWIVASLSWRYVETPFRRSRRSRQGEDLHDGGADRAAAARVDLAGRAAGA